jgi:SSS family solute:Na+ symporter
MQRTLGSLQVASLLVSASYGIGLLFGTGEQALSHGMAGGIYGVATGAGMLLLAVLARRLWTTGLPIWDLFAQFYGVGLQRPVALLSLVWMAGVLAAQIHGGVAVMQLLRLGYLPGLLLVLALLFGVSRLELRFAATVFSLCLVASAVVLVYALVSTNGLGLYLHAIPLFLGDAGSFPTGQLLAILLAVSLLVCMGADYQQFVLAAKSPWAAFWGCVLAALALFAIGFLPAALVVAMMKSGALNEFSAGKQVIPLILGQVAGTLGPAAEKSMLMALSVAALGSGAAILRAMTDALASAVPAHRVTRRPVLTLVALATGAGLAARDQGIIDTMVSVNVVYIASIGVAFVALMRGTALPLRHASATMGTGFVLALGVQLVSWAGWTMGDTDMVSLMVGMSGSMAMALLLRSASLRRAVRPAS